VDAGERSALVDRIQGAIEPSALQRAKPAVRGLLEVERRRPAEVGGFDQRRTQPAAAGLVRDGQPGDAAADHQHVVRSGNEAREVARTHQDGGFIL